MHKEISDPQGHYHILICDINCTTYTVVNVYTPNKHQLRFIHQVLKKVQKGFLLLICRDFNLPPDPQMDFTYYSHRHHHSLQSTLHTQELYDTWKCLHGMEKDYSLFSTSHRIYTRLDFLLTDKWLVRKITASKINTITWSDHASVMLSVNDSPNVNTSFVWRSNPRFFQVDPSKIALQKDLTVFSSCNLNCRTPWLYGPPIRHI